MLLIDTDLTNKYLASTNTINQNTAKASLT